MARVIKLIDDEVRITDGNSVISIKVDEENEYYQQVKAETNNFTENMNQKDPLEQMAQTQIDLIFQLMVNGVI